MPIERIEAFDETSDDLNAYVERVEQYFIANEIKDEKRVAVTLSLMGKKRVDYCEICVPQRSHSAFLLRILWKPYRNICHLNHCL